MARKMAFVPQMRIRTEEEEPRLIAQQINRYKRHLDSINHKSAHHKANASVYRYFGMDLFHDGPIERFEITSDFRTLRFRIMAPYIHQLSDSRKSTYFWFQCEFSDIAFLHVGSRKIDDLNNPLSENLRERVEYNISEIDTMNEELNFFRNYYQYEFSSLIVDTHPTERSMALIFRKGLVQPEKPLAFERMRSGKYHLYLYEHSLARMTKGLKEKRR
jgi:hypothetical protein